MPFVHEFLSFKEITTGTGWIGQKHLVGSYIIYNKGFLPVKGVVFFLGFIGGLTERSAGDKQYEKYENNSLHSGLSDIYHRIFKFSNFQIFKFSNFQIIMLFSSGIPLLPVG